MAGILTDLKKTVITGFIVALLLFGVYYLDGTMDLLGFLFRWSHVLFGITWIGMLYYFNFVQGGYFKQASPEGLADAKAKLAPSALWWFRWGAMGTIITGLILAYMNGYIGNVLSLGLVDDSTSGHRMLGIGMWFGIIMFGNVWFIIWPKQKIALGIVDGTADEKAAAGRTAMLFSRTNTLLSFPMLFAMIAAQGLYNIS